MRKQTVMKHFLSDHKILQRAKLTVMFQVFKAAQPALLYLVPFTLLPLFAMAYLKVSY